MEYNLDIRLPIPDSPTPGQSYDWSVLHLVSRAPCRSCALSSLTPCRNWHCQVLRLVGVTHCQVLRLVSPAPCRSYYALSCLPLIKMNRTMVSKRPSSATRLSCRRIPRLTSDIFTSCHTESERGGYGFCPSRSLTLTKPVGSNPKP